MAMALGIFAGTGMDAKAEEPWRMVEYALPDTLAKLEQACVEVENNNDSYDFVYNYCDAHRTHMVLCYYEGKVQAFYYNIGHYVSGVMHQSFGTWDILCNNIDGLKRRGYSLYILQENTTPSSSEGASGAEAASSTPHTHSYSWVTVQEANAGQDGIEEYRCSCGDVQGRNVIPASEAAVKGLFGEIKNAPQNGTATFDSGRLYTISDYVIKKLAERTDVTTVITFEYQNQAYKMTIPAGADFTSLLADEDYFYGYFFFANAVGATIEAIA